MNRRGILVWAGVTLLSSAVAIAGQAPAGQTAKPGSQTAKPATQTAKPAGQTAKPAAPAAAAAKPATPKSPGAGPVFVVDTDKGTFEFETYPTEAPKTVQHILALVKRNFYNGQRVHRVVPGFVVQFGDPQTRDMTKRANWGSGGSGKPVGAAEMSPKRLHKVGAVAMAHSGDPKGADSQMYIALSAERTRQLDGGYTVFGQVISGMPVVQKITELTIVKRVSLRPEAPAAPAVKTPTAK